MELLTLSEIVDVQGGPGNFTIKIKKKPRYVDTDKCIACGLCAEKCPKKVDDEFNADMGKRKAIYIKYGQSVPLKYAIDPDNCIYLTRGKCRACEKFCPTGAINFDDKEEIISINVGAVILAPGFKPFDPSGLDSYGYKILPDVVTSLEYERMLSAGGPFQGHLVRPSDHNEPKKIAWIQCVGSRNTNQCKNGYCSNVCCMYAIKQAMVTSEHIKGESSEQSIFYMDIRSHGKEFERYYEGARESGIRFIQARPHTIDPGKNNNGVVMRYTDTNGHQVVEKFDLAVLSIGLEAPDDAPELAEKFQIGLNSYGFAATSDFSPVSTSRSGVFVTGAFQAPKDIPQSVTEASTAAAEVSRLLSASRGSLTKTKTYPPENDVKDQIPSIGVFICSCGINIANTVDVHALAEYAKELPYVSFVDNNLFTCSADTQAIIAEKIKEHKLNRIVIAACTPRTHEPLFQDTLKEASLNGYLVEMVNIRNQNSWVHQKEPEKATQKAKDQVWMTVARIAKNYPLEQLKVKVVRKALIIGGGLAGMNAALALADQGYPCVLMDKNDRLGGNAWYLNKTYKGVNIRPILEKIIDSVENHEKIEVIKNAALLSVNGSVGNFSSEIETNGKKISVKYGAAVVATGAKESRPAEYMYGKDDRIMTHLEFDYAIREDEDTIKNAKSAVFIQCVGSRDEKRPYCSRVCCTHSVESAIHLKTINPDMNVYILYRDMRTYGDREDLYKKARDLGVLFIRFNRNEKPEVSIQDNEIYVKIYEPVVQLPVKLYADFLILAAAIEPNKNDKLVELYKCSLNQDGFLNEAHPKLRPVDMPVDGLFVAGICNYPKPVDESIAQALAAASRAGVILAKEKMELDAIKSMVTDRCDGCALCVDVCPYNAIKLVQDSKTGYGYVESDPALCKGCGICEATCPKGGIIVHGFTIEQMQAQVDAALTNQLIY